MKQNIVIDIETRADPRLDTPDYWQKIMEEIPDNRAIKDPLKQEAWKGQKLEDFKATMALRATTGKVAAIGYSAISNPSAETVICDLADEVSVLGGFVDTLMTQFPGKHVVCGFNCREFDIPFVTARCAVHGIDLPRWWPFIRDWTGVADLRDVLGRNGTLDDWLTAFRMENKPCTGKESLDLTEDELADYCLQDVRATANLFEKLWERFPALWSKKDRKPA